MIDGQRGDVEDVGRNIRAARKEAKLTQTDLADLAGISERTVRAIETGSGNPAMAAVASAANVLGLRITLSESLPTAVSVKQLGHPTIGGRDLSRKIDPMISVPI